MHNSNTKLLTEQRGRILVITINRPEARNACDHDVALAMEQALDRLDADNGLWLGIITGANGNFSAGADLKAVASGKRAETEKRGGFGIFARPSKKPLIAAVEGFAVGGGFELCLCADLVVAARNAQFGLPEVRHNVVAIGGALFRLQKRLPYNVASELALTGTFRNAEFFHQYGVVNRVTEPGQAFAGALTLADEILSNGPTAVWATHEIMFQSNFWNENEAWSRQLAIAEAALNSEDAREGLKAFAEKRKPAWKGC